MITLSEQQTQAVELCLQPIQKTTILTGRAGAGKSTIIRELSKYSSVSLAATTGMAAINIGGVTVDRLFSYNRTTEDVRDAGTLYRNMVGCGEIIVIDECSMIGSAMGNFLAKTAAEYKKTLVLVGDYAQAAPVKDGWATRSRLLDGARLLKLTECHRQNDRVFLDALDALRVADLTNPAVQALSACMVASAPTDDGWTHIYATNAAADAYNRQKLAALTTDALPPVKAVATKVKGSWFAGEEERTIADSRLLHGWTLKIGARVIITQNARARNDEDSDQSALPYVNGDAGELVGWNGTKDFVQHMHVKLDRTGDVVFVPRVEKEILDGRKHVIAAVAGFPITLGYAITIHRSQGQTLDKVFVDMGSVTQFPVGSRHGLAYVALSRARTLEGLRIANWSPTAVECDNAVRHLL